LDSKAPDAFRTISEVADEIDLPQHVLRFWESRFHEIKPMKRGGGRRYYRPDDVELLRGIRHLLYGEGYTIRGVQRILREQGIKFVQAVWQDGAPQPPHGASDEEDAGEDAGLDTVSDLDEENRGIGERLGSLIGRDFSDRNEAGEGRRDPPLTSAPVPRIDATDRAIHGVTAPVMPEAEPLSAVRAAPPKENATLGHGDLRKLHAVLHELAECRKLIDAANVRAE
jgi:DNA-binding transcriptional MerR regulator